MDGSACVDEGIVGDEGECENLFGAFFRKFVILGIEGGINGVMPLMFQEKIRRLRKAWFGLQLGGDIVLRILSGGS